MHNLNNPKQTKHLTSEELIKSTDKFKVLEKILLFSITVRDEFVAREKSLLKFCSKRNCRRTNLK